MNTVLTYVFAWLFFLPMEAEHAVYISVVEIREGSVQVKVFTDDLQNAIRNFDPNYRVTADDDFCSENRQSIQSYFAANLKITINDRPVAFNYESASKEGDSYWISFGMMQTGPWKSIAVEDRHFMELFPTQTNIIKIMGGKQRFCKLTTSKPDCRFPL